jgi:hypothetical protein
VFLDFVGVPKFYAVDRQEGAAVNQCGGAFQGISEGGILPYGPDAGRALSVRKFVTGDVQELVDRMVEFELKRLSVLQHPLEPDP